MTAITQEQLLEHSDWLRGLAARLVSDPATADDLVQETWISALGANAGLAEGGRPWLARVLRNKARNRWRAKTRREDHEALAEESQMVPTPEELTREAEAQQIVALAVTQLDEPYRSVIVLRFFRGLDATEIGKLHKISPSTVRSRVQRALTELRGQLDEEHGSRSAWSALLLPVLHTEVRGAAAGAVVASGTWLTLVLSIAAACAIAWFGVRHLGGSTQSPGGETLVGVPSTLTLETNEPLPESKSEGLASANLRESANSPAELTTSPTSTTANAAASAPASSSGTSASSTVDESLGDDARISGRFLMPDGTPAADLELRISARSVSPQRTAIYGLPDEWTAPEVRTDEEGRFETTFAVPRAYGYGLDAKIAGHAPDSWFWWELLPGTAIDVGTVHVREGGIVEGTLTRPDGTPIAGESWRVTIKESSPPEAFGRRRFYGTFEVDRLTGAFRATDLPPCSLTLAANSPMSEEVAGPSLVVASGQVHVVPFVYDGPDSSKSLVVSTRNRLRQYVGSLRPGSIRVVGGSDGPRSIEPIEGKIDLYRVDDLEPGSYVVEIDDERFEPVLLEAVATGSKVQVELVGTCNLDLSFVDTAGEELAIESIILQFTEAEMYHSELGIVEPITARSGFQPQTIWPSEDVFVEGRLVGMVPGSYHLTVNGPDDEQAEAEVQNLVAGESRHVTLSLGAESSGAISGLLLKEDGSPAGSVEVWLLFPAQIGDHAGSQILRPNEHVWPDTAYRKIKAKTVSAADGSFSFDEDGDAEFALAATDSALGEVATEAFIVTGGVGPGPIELRFPPEVILQARISGPAGSSTAGMSAYVIPSTMNPEGMEFFQLSLRSRRLLGPNGEFEAKGLAPGSYIPYLVLPPTQARPGSGSNTLSSTGGAGSDLALDEVQLIGGVNELELEVLSGFPGEALIEVIVDGEARPILEIKLRSTDPDRGGSRKGFTGMNGEPASLIAFPGAHEFEIVDQDAGWSYRSDHVLVVPAAGTIERRTEFELANGRLVVSDSSGAPLAGAAVMVTFPEGIRAWIGEPRICDDEGGVDAILVPGEYRCYLLALDGSDAQAVQAAKFSLMRNDCDLEHRSLTWSAAGAEVSF